MTMFFSQLYPINNVKLYKEVSASFFHDPSQDTVESVEFASPWYLQVKFFPLVQAC